MSTKAEYEKTSYGTFERLVYLVLIPIVFATLLTFGLLHIFGVNVKDAVLTVGNKIPVVHHLLPEPSTAPVTDDLAGDTVQNSEEMTSKLLELETRLGHELEKSEQNELHIAHLEQLIRDMEIEQATRMQTDEEYESGIQQLSQVYAKMSPSKAAGIIQNLTLHEQVLVLNEMIPADQTKILEKMNPVTAAEVSILLKDQMLTKDVQIAALQERLALHRDEDTATILLSTQELALTFANMAPANAATVLVEMLEISDEKVVNIMRAMDLQARSRVLSAITDLSSAEAAKLSAKLG